MDETAHRSARGEINRLPCVFERALRARCAVCDLSAPHAPAERESIACTSPLARAACGELAGLLREKSSFALGLARTTRILPHAMVMKIQCGGLAGLQQVLDPDAPAPDVHRLVRAARERFGNLAELPFSRIVQGVAAWRGRRRHI
ncbi:MAG: hypothetical protein OHM77_12315 [Candidatus Nitricoxidivorans perseverans]|uniref:Uncharacterized protein n=1 Tax=Candidatus Nitricoxidivorans perseverans TaxID=2975601 RepID=A0AA49FK58_9PROT|nr:MAG: hypothetical protein OHM77_12315 [Candidatus Nitricoxidivorans perseverans]